MSRDFPNLTLENMVPRRLRVKASVRAMMATFKRAVRQGDLKDCPGEEVMAAGYGRTLGEALDLIDNVLDVEVSERVAAATKDDVMFEHLVDRAQRQLLLVLLNRLGDVKISVDELEPLGGGLAIDMQDDGCLVFRRHVVP